MANSSDQLEHELNLRGQLFLPHAKLQIAWIPTGMTGFQPHNIEKWKRPNPTSAIKHNN